MPNQFEFLLKEELMHNLALWLWILYSFTCLYYSLLIVYHPLPSDIIHKICHRQSSLCNLQSVSFETKSLVCFVCNQVKWAWSRAQYLCVTLYNFAFYLVVRGINIILAVKLFCKLVLQIRSNFKSYLQFYIFRFNIGYPLK